MFASAAPSLQSQRNVVAAFGDFEGLFLMRFTHDRQLKVATFDFNVIWQRHRTANLLGVVGAFIPTKE